MINLPEHKTATVGQFREAARLMGATAIQRQLPFNLTARLPGINTAIQQGQNPGTTAGSGIAPTAE